MSMHDLPSGHNALFLRLIVADPQDVLALVQWRYRHPRTCRGILSTAQRPCHKILFQRHLSLDIYSFPVSMTYAAVRHAFPGSVSAKTTNTTRMSKARRPTGRGGLFSSPSSRRPLSRRQCRSLVRRSAAKVVPPTDRVTRSKATPLENNTPMPECFTRIVERGELHKPDLCPASNQC